MTHISSVLNRLNRRKGATERGFSLIELIIVIVILGVLVAIAIPVYNNIQDKAKENAVATAASNGASQAAAAFANGTTPDLTNLESGDITSVTVTGTTTENFCVTATSASYTKTSGPGC